MTVVAFVLQIPLLLSAALTPVPLSQPLMVDAASGGVRAAASAHGEFFTNGRRIAADGTLIDGEPLLNTQGIPLQWRDGWRTVRQDAGMIRLTSIPRRSAPEAAASLPSRGSLSDAAANGERIAIVELEDVNGQQRVWITVLDDLRIVQRRVITAADNAVIAAFGEGFLLATSVRSTVEGSLVHGWLLTADGSPREVRDLMTTDPYPTLSIATRGNTAVIAARTFSRFSVSIVGSDLAGPPAIARTASVNAYGEGVTIALPSGAVQVLYAQSGGQHRVLEITHGGTVVSDTAAEPVRELARSGDRFLVVRPWGDVAIAEGAPQNITTEPIALRNRTFPASERELASAVAGDVTLTVFRSETGVHRAVRVAADGTHLDAQALMAPSMAVDGFDGGFAFAWYDASGQILLRRLSREEGWIDQAPIAVSRELTRSVAVGASRSSILVAWIRGDGVAWRRYAFDGTPLDAAPRVAAHASGVAPSRVSVAASATSWLISAQETFICNLSPCVMPDQFVETFALTENGTTHAAPVATRADDSSAPVALTDGTWVLPILRDDVRLLHIASDGTIAAEIAMPSLDGLPVDVATTPAGWKGIFTSPSRIVEFVSVATPTSLTGLPETTDAGFAGELISLLMPDPDSENAVRPWLTSPAASESDLSIEVVNHTRAGVPAIFEIIIRNDGPADALHVVLTAELPLQIAGPRTFASIAAGGELRMRAIISNPTPWHEPRITVSSVGTRDVHPSDNTTRVSFATPAPVNRNRGVRTIRP